jgi:hypothetical protein
MKSIAISTIAAAVSLAFGAASAAEIMSKPQYEAGKKTIEATYKTDKVACKPLVENAKDVCMVQAKGREKVALAELEESFAPSHKTHYDVRIAKADAEYAVAKEKCDDKAGNGKDVCRKEAQAARTIARADAQTQLKTTDANATAGEKSAKAREQADRKVAVARRDAQDDKLDAEYAVAKEKCDALAGTPKDQCVNAAKARFGKS